MVYPHSNDIGKEKPPTNKGYSGLDSLSVILQEVYGVSAAQYSQYFEAFNEASKKTYNPLPKAYNPLPSWMQPKPFPKAKEDPVLLEGPKANFAFFNAEPSLPTSIDYKAMRIDMRVEGLPMKDKRIGLTYLLPEHEVTESELKALLRNQFEAIENQIINSIKKEKGIK